MATWISITLIAWVALSVIGGLLIGGMIRVADSREAPAALGAGRGRAPHRPTPTPTPLRRVS